MKRFALLLLLSSLACSRSTTRSTAPVARRDAVRAARPAARPLVAEPGAALDHEAEEQREIMEAMRAVSAFPATSEGLRDFVRSLSRAYAAHDREGVERLQRELVADDVRFELAISFEGTRQLRERVVPGLGARAEALGARLGALRTPVAVTVTSALGSEFSDGSAHGFSPAIASVKAFLRPAVRFYRAEAVGADGQRVVVEPMAYLAGRWTWLGEPWTAVPAPPPSPAPAPVAAAGR